VIFDLPSRREIEQMPVAPIDAGVSFIASPAGESVSPAATTCKTQNAVVNGRSAA